MGKCSPSLRKKTLYNVERCNLSITDKTCIKAAFEKLEFLEKHGTGGRQWPTFKRWNLVEGLEGKEHD